MRDIFGITLLLVALCTSGLAMEQRPMSTLVEISHQAADELGRPELVADFAGGDYTPTTKFLRIINDAHRHLDRRQWHDNLEQTRRVALAAGEWSIAAPSDLRFVTRIDLEDSDGKITPAGGLKQRDIKWLRDLYGERFDLVATGPPVYWARGGSASNIVPFAQAIGDFADVDHSFFRISYLSGESWSLNDGVLEKSATGSGYLTSTSLVVSLGNVTADSTVIVAYDAGAGSILYDVDTLTPSFSNSLSGSGTAEVSIPAGSSYLLLSASSEGGISVSSVSFEQSVEVPSLTIPWFTCLPRADKAYTAVIHGAYWARRMLENTDETWWSAQHPDILVPAIKRQVASALNRNQTEVNEYDQVIEQALYDLEVDAALEDVTGDPESLRFGYRS
jgi:hypothetical protein